MLSHHLARILSRVQFGDVCSCRCFPGRKACGDSVSRERLAASVDRDRMRPSPSFPLRAFVCVSFSLYVFVGSAFAQQCVMQPRITQAVADAAPDRAAGKYPSAGACALRPGHGAAITADGTDAAGSEPQPRTGHGSRAPSGRPNWIGLRPTTTNGLRRSQEVIRPRAQINVGTTGPHALAVRPNPTSAAIGWGISTFGSMLIGLLLLGNRTNRRLATTLVSIVVIAFLLGSAGCGGSGSSAGGGGGSGGGGVQIDPGTPAGTYTATVTGTSGTTSHSTTFTLIVQK
jgi:hypothetical protein